jgi:hypothetical protein
VCDREPRKEACGREVKGEEIVRTCLRCGVTRALRKYNNWSEVIFCELKYILTRRLKRKKGPPCQLLITASACEGHKSRQSMSDSTTAALCDSINNIRPLRLYGATLHKIHSPLNVALPRKAEATTSFWHTLCCITPRSGA